MADRRDVRIKRDGGRLVVGEPALDEMVRARRGVALLEICGFEELGPG
jgi:hypothetical protein